MDEIDPHNYDLITFAKLIEVLSEHFADHEKTKNLIEFLNSI